MFLFIEYLTSPANDQAIKLHLKIRNAQHHEQSAPRFAFTEWLIVHDVMSFHEGVLCELRTLCCSIKHIGRKPISSWRRAHQQLRNCHRMPPEPNSQHCYRSRLASCKRLAPNTSPCSSSPWVNYRLHCPNNNNNNKHIMETHS